MHLTLKAARTKKGWSLGRLASESGIYKSTLIRLEHGRTKPLHDTVTTLETALGLKPGTLVFGQREVLA